MPALKRIPIHPGSLLKEELDERGMSANAFAKALGVPTNRITEILRERRNVTAETALRLAAYLGGSPEFWLNLQTNHELGKARVAMKQEDLRRIKKQAA